MAVLAFIAVLILSISLGISIIWALAAGYMIFFIHAILSGLDPKSVLRISLEGVYETRNILSAFVLIGMLTATWRAAGTIPSVIIYSLPVIRPEWFLGAVFLINCLISFLTGTSFGSAATVGVISMTMAHSIGVSPVLAGGAVLSGVFFGDRCSPVSTSALLVADLTGTEVRDNIPIMMRSSSIPFALSLAAYSLISMFMVQDSSLDSELAALFISSFRIGFIPLIPAILMLLLSFFRFGTKRTMAVSVLAALLICIFYEGMDAGSIPSLLLSGFKAENPELGKVLNGGGIASMIDVALIVAISSSYAGIFRETGLLESLRKRLESLSHPRPAIAAVAVLTSMISCNQTLATMLTHQLCSKAIKERKDMVLALENTVIVIAPLIPWSIAGSVPLSVIGAPSASLAAAFYLYLLPICWIINGKSRKTAASGFSITLGSRGESL